MKTLTPLLLLFLIFASCEKESKPFEFDEKNYSSESLSECKNGICPKIEINLIEAQGNSELSKTINNALEKRTASGLTMNPDDEDKIKTIDQGIANFIEAYRTATTDFPGSSASEGYEFTSNATLGFESEDLLSIVIETYSYWGGAHGYGSLGYLNFDKVTGVELATNDLIKDEQKFKALAEKLFREQEEIPLDGNINQAGFFFEEDTFSLPQNIGFEEGNLLLVYNPYEVAAYAEGQIIIKIPKAEADPFLSVRL